MGAAVLVMLVGWLRLLKREKSMDGWTVKMFLGRIKLVVPWRSEPIHDCLSDCNMAVWLILLVFYYPKDKKLFLGSEKVWSVKDVTVTVPTLIFYSSF